jgi:hypothetical protein
MHSGVGLCNLLVCLIMTSSRPKEEGYSCVIRSILSPKATAVAFRLAFELLQLRNYIQLRCWVFDQKSLRLIKNVTNRFMNSDGQNTFKKYFENTK